MGTYYYAVSAQDGAAQEGPLSFIVTASIAAGATNASVALKGLSFSSNARSFNVYRGKNPQLLYRIASQLQLGEQFSDTGLAAQAIGPPDPNFSRANFYYRLELAGPLNAELRSANTIGNPDMNATPSIYTGMTVRIIAGTGTGQERFIVGNDESTLSVVPDWSAALDSSSIFAITEPGWRFATLSGTSPAEFEVPNQMGTVVQVTGRAANVRNEEAAGELCPVTRWVVGGSAGNQLDLDVAPAPNYVLDASGQGNLTLSQVGFDSLTNTRSVTAGTLQVLCYNELAGPTPYAVASAIDATTDHFVLNDLLTDSGTPVLQVGTELMVLLQFDEPTKVCKVIRGQFGSIAVPHNPGETVLALRQKTFVNSFARDFFANPASQNFSHTIHVPDVRVIAAQFYVTNSRGNSPASTQVYLSTPDGGLRTCSGGQFAMQVGGYLAVQQNAAPPLLIEAAHAPRDIRASVTESSASMPVVLQMWQDSTVYCSLTIPAGQRTSNILNGKDLPPLKEGAILRLDVTQVALASQGSPGRDLTVTIRL